MMAILVLARAYVRSRFTPTVFRSWRLAAGRLPCYFILCLLLLEATPQTRKVAMGILLVGAPTAPTAIQNAQPHPPILGNVDVVNVTRGVSGWTNGYIALPNVTIKGSGATSHTSRLPDIKKFAGELGKMRSARATPWSPKFQAVAAGRKKELQKRVKRNALRKTYGSFFEPTWGRLGRDAEKLDLLDTSSFADMSFGTDMREESDNVNFSFGMLSYYDAKKQVTRFTLLRDLEDFTKDPLGNDFVYIINPNKRATRLSDQDVKTVRELVEVVRQTVATLLPKLPPNLEGSDEVLVPTKVNFVNNHADTRLLFLCPPADKDFYLNKISVESKEMNFALTVKVYRNWQGYTEISALSNSEGFIPSDTGKFVVYKFNRQKLPHRITNEEMISLRKASIYVPPKNDTDVSSAPSVVNSTTETPVSPESPTSPHILTTEDIQTLPVTPVAPTTDIYSAPSVVTSSLALDSSLADTTDVPVYAMGTMLMAVAVLVGTSGLLVISILVAFVIYKYRMIQLAKLTGSRDTLLRGND
eukprot:GHVS01052391.1.p1 GENE.GHVS01052391.1~~GHVS01052391.1.p1  ORF type:complete len:529 (-),score=29.83 GHVS01052391.1:494-2080(-)